MQKSGEKAKPAEAKARQPKANREKWQCCVRPKKEDTANSLSTARRSAAASKQASAPTGEGANPIAAAAAAPVEAPSVTLAEEVFVNEEIQPLIETVKKYIPEDTEKFSSTGEEGKERLKLVERPGSTANLVKDMAEIMHKTEASDLTDAEIEAKSKELVDEKLTPEEIRIECMADRIANGIEAKYPKVERAKKNLIDYYAKINAQLRMKGVTIQQMSELSINHENGKFKLLQAKLLDKCASNPEILKDCVETLGLAADTDIDTLKTKIETPNAHDTVAKLQAKYGIPLELSIFARTFFAGGPLPDSETETFDKSQKEEYQNSLSILSKTDTRDLAEQRTAVDDMVGHQPSEIPAMKKGGQNNPGIVFHLVPKYTIAVYKILSKATREKAANGDQLDFPDFFKESIVNEDVATEGNLYQELFDEGEPIGDQKLGTFIDEQLKSLALPKEREGEDALYSNKEVIALLSAQAEVLGLSNDKPEGKETSPRQDKIIELMTAIKEQGVMDEVGELFDCGLGIYNPSRMASILGRGDAWISGIIGMARVAKGFKNLQQQSLLNPMKELSEVLEGNKDEGYEFLCKQVIAQNLQPLGCSRERAQELVSLGAVFYAKADITTGAWVQPLESAQSGCRVVRNDKGDVLADSVQQLTATATNPEEVKAFAEGGIINYVAISNVMLHPPVKGEPTEAAILAAATAKQEAAATAKQEAAETAKQEAAGFQRRFAKFGKVIEAMNEALRDVEPTPNIDLKTLRDLKALNARLEKDPADIVDLLKEKQALISTVQTELAKAANPEAVAALKAQLDPKAKSPQEEQLETLYEELTQLNVDLKKIEDAEAEAAEAGTEVIEIPEKNSLKERKNIKVKDMTTLMYQNKKLIL